MKIDKYVSFVLTFVCYLSLFILQVDFLSLGVQDAKGNYLIIPPKPNKTNAAGSIITYGKKSGKEYVYIPGPITKPLRFMVRD